MLDADGWKQRFNVKTHTLGQQIDEAHLHGDFPLSSELLQRTTCRSLFVLDGNRNVSRRVFPRSRNNSCYGETRRFSTTGFLPGKHARFLCSTAVIAISSVLCLACAMCCSVVDSCALGFRLLYQLTSDFVFCISLHLCALFRSCYPSTESTASVRVEYDREIPGTTPQRYCIVTQYME